MIKKGCDRFPSYLRIGEKPTVTKKLGKRTIPIYPYRIVNQSDERVVI